MCTTCGCGSSQEHGHGHHSHEVDKLEKSILDTNEKYAEINRKFLEEKSNVSLNFVSSPGSGKTSLLEVTISKLQGISPVVVVEGDQHTDLDADRIRAAGAEAYQINTGKACHLDAHMVGHAFEHLDIKPNGFVMIENVGNLICPAMFDLGETHRVAVISTTEGADKPLKYPDMFYYADTVVINKTDLLPYVDFDIDQCEANIRKIRSNARIFRVSVKTEDGIDEWMNWLKSILIEK
jgi:hydrogenase nickel incorporation protein HypB